jgi:hypothetical protein
LGENKIRSCFFSESDLRVGESDEVLEEELVNAEEDVEDVEGSEVEKSRSEGKDEIKEHN